MAIVLFAFWLILSPKYDAVHISMGAFSAMFIAQYTRPLFRDTEWSSLIHPRFLAYVPWLLWQIVIANFQVAYAVLHPRLPIDPCMVKIKTGLKRPVAKLALANSITLTPGTITVDVDADEFEVHALMPASLSALEASNGHAGEMVARIQKVFGEVS